MVNLILGCFALLSLVLTLWQWLVARRFPLHQRRSNPLDREGERPREPKHLWSSEEVWARADARPPSRRVGCHLREEAQTSIPQPSTLNSQPPVTLLKPLKGSDATTELSLRSWFTQDYAGPTQLLLGVASADDPVCDIVRRLQQDFPGSDAQLVVCGPPLGPNAKVSQLAELERRTKHDVLIISDADVRVPPDLLGNIVVPLGEAPLSPTEGERERERGPSHYLRFMRGGASGEPNLMGRLHNSSRAHWARDDGPLTPTLSPSEGEREKRRQCFVNGRFMEGACGLVCCFFRLAHPTTLAMRWEAIAINADFWSQVLQSRSLKPMNFALGAVMAVRRRQLQEIGGFTPLADYLADDYQLGNRIARGGYSIALSPVVVECWAAPMGWGAVWNRQLRWARTIRVCQPLPYFFSILSNASLWPLLWLIGQPSPLVAACAALCWLVRILSAMNLQQRLNQDSTSGGRASSRALSSESVWVREDARPSTPASWRYAWLVPVKDLLQAVLWLLAFLGNRIEWHGQRLRLRRDGRLAKR